MNTKIPLYVSIPLYAVHTENDGPGHFSCTICHRDISFPHLYRDDSLVRSLIIPGNLTLLDQLVIILVA